MSSLSSTHQEVLPPPSERYTLLGWVQKNLFNSWLNGILTLVSLALLYIVLTGIIGWALTTADWNIVRVNLRLFLVGQYPVDQLWRIWLGVILFAGLAGVSWAVWRRTINRWVGTAALLIPLALAALPLAAEYRLELAVTAVVMLLSWLFGKWKPSLARQAAVTGWIVIFPIFMILVRGLTDESGFLPVVFPALWGGLLLTFMLTVVGIVFSFPIGILLALGRRSTLLVAKWLSILYIELVRGVPLVTILFMSTFMLPLFMPSNVNPDRILRAMVGITLFSAAYLAENVRGGLQAIPRGQFEAAHALGLNGFQTMSRIVLPQALRLVIPVLVGQFIALFKDTSLVAIVGLFDLLGIADTVLAQPDFIGLQIEAYLFISLLYFIFSYLMSFLSERLEKSLGVGER